MVRCAKTGRSTYGQALMIVPLVMAMSAVAEWAEAAPRYPVHNPAGAPGNSSMQQIQDQVRSQQRQAQQEMLDRSRAAPPANEPPRTGLPASPQNQAIRCQRQQREIQSGERPQVSGDCRVWRREQYRPMPEP
ncbi:hypothetical protein [Marinobacter zhejiangensis]|uniref:Uncharacterized protein n=1 Tax=Marinobacter zhejiangensis TaxID=488535 RepID=A0A1I4TH39_9GAMM|nr:hypothetical protein [Marinobacter zhejiangensis]SFM75953.1 hypothetical protein SAMN04487963_3623 [Marinobacter zhejiangensis]